MRIFSVVYIMIRIQTGRKATKIERFSEEASNAKGFSEREIGFLKVMMSKLLLEEEEEDVVVVVAIVVDVAVLLLVVVVVNPSSGNGS